VDEQAERIQNIIAQSERTSAPLPMTEMFRPGSCLSLASCPATSPFSRRE
jgi:hypothetical protein